MNYKKIIKSLLYFCLGLGVGTSLLVAALRLLWHGTYFPGVTIAHVNVGGLTQEQAKTLLLEEVQQFSPTLVFGDTHWTLSSTVYMYSLQDSAAEAYRVGRRRTLSDYLAIAQRKETHFPLITTLNEDLLNSWIVENVSPMETHAVLPRIELLKDQVVITNGTDGTIVDGEQLRALLIERARTLDTTPIPIPFKNVYAALDEEGLRTLETKALAIRGDSLELSQDDEKTVVTQDQLLEFLVDARATRAHAISLAGKWRRDPQDAKFAFADGRVKEFSPSKDGIEVNVDEAVRQIDAALIKLLADSKSEKIEVAVIRTPPEVTTESVNNLGIVERIGRGESYYAHSIPNRVFNVGLASQRVNGALVAPGEEFSFNKFVGEISGATGYRTAYVIQNGRTVLGDGGGVCQVSTTLFRAVMNAGLPITERWGHAYRVGYYEQNSDPGIDATVYSPSKDFKFVNDTPRHILVQVTNDPKNLHLVFEIYGTKDGRVATITKPRVTGVSPPPPDIYEEDPNLPAGQVKQVDWSAWGAKTSFDYTVVKADGTPLFAKTYVTNYRPWANVYLRGTATQ